ncbi:MAG TPA: hypothetical protein VFT22_20880, partial [Kofleriaceae bacterium]|nr:hypothetical protein [Kofleriaceae bacterium]
MEIRLVRALPVSVAGGVSMPMNPRIAERHLFERPDTDGSHAVLDEDLIRDTSLATPALIGRILIAAIFLV